MPKQAELSHSAVHGFSNPHFLQGQMVQPKQEPELLPEGEAQRSGIPAGMVWTAASPSKQLPGRSSSAGTCYASPAWWWPRSLASLFNMCKLTPCPGWLLQSMPCTLRQLATEQTMSSSRQGLLLSHHTHLSTWTELSSVSFFVLCILLHTMR